MHAAAALVAAVVVLFPRLDRSVGVSEQSRCFRAVLTKKKKVFV